MSFECDWSLGILSTGWVRDFWSFHGERINLPWVAWCQLGKRAEIWRWPPVGWKGSPGGTWMLLYQWSSSAAVSAARTSSLSAVGNLTLIFIILPSMITSPTFPSFAGNLPLSDGAFTKVSGLLSNFIMRSPFPVCHRFLKNAVKFSGAVPDLKNLTRSALERPSDALTRITVGCSCFNFLGFIGFLWLFLLGGTVRRSSLLSYGGGKCVHKGVERGEMVQGRGSQGWGNRIPVIGEETEGLSWKPWTWSWGLFSG